MMPMGASTPPATGEGDEEEVEVESEDTMDKIVVSETRRVIQNIPGITTGTTRVQLDSDRGRRRSAERRPVASVQPAPPPAKPAPSRDRDIYTTSGTASVGRAGGGKGRGKKAGPPMDPAPEMPMEEITIGGEIGGKLEVHASAVTVHIPAAGELVRYQHLLLPADADTSVELSARRTSRRQP